MVPEDGSIGEAKLATSAVTESRIADAAVTEDKIADGAVTGDKLAEGTIPLAALDATLDLFTRGNPVRSPVRIATTANVNLSGGAPLSHDGVTLALGDRVLAHQQSTSAQKGIYVVSVPGSGSNGTWSRAPDANTNGDLFEGVEVYVQEGTANAGKTYRLTSAGVPNLGVDPQTWTEVVVSGSVTVQHNNTPVADYDTIDFVDSSTVAFTVTDEGDRASVEAVVPDGSITEAKMNNAPGLSVLGKPTSGTGTRVDIQSTVNGQFFQRAGGNLVWDTLPDATGAVKGIIQLAGMLGNTAASPDVRGIRETGGPTDLTIAGISNGDFLRRSGTTIVGDDPSTIVAEGLPGGTDPGDLIVYDGADFVTFAVGAAGQLITVDPDAAEGLSYISWIDPAFGDASDGNVTLGADDSLNKNMQYDVLDLAGFNLTVAGFMIRARKIINSGGACVIRANGGSSTLTSAGTAAATAFLGGGGAGAAGRTGAAQTGANANPTSSNDSWPAHAGGNAGDGGQGGASGGGNNGGVAGNASGPTASLGWGGRVMLDTGHLVGNDTITQLTGGLGGSSGGNQLNSNSGGGGGGGGILLVWARELDCANVTFQANGGNGGNAAIAAGAGAGGGGGGGGGHVEVIYEIGTALPTLEATAGNGGALAGTGVIGANGNAGTTHFTALRA